MKQTEYEMYVKDIQKIFGETEVFKKFLAVQSHLIAQIHALKAENLSYNLSIQKMHEDRSFKLRKIVYREKQIIALKKVSGRLLKLSKRVFNALKKRKIEIQLVTGKPIAPIDIVVKKRHLKRVGDYLGKMESITNSKYLT